MQNEVSFNPWEFDSKSHAPKVKILCVDDQEANLIALRAALSGSNYKIIEAQSGREALSCLIHHDFAVILLDVQMPIMDGFETARMIRRNEHSKHTPIIFLTANYPSETHALKGYESGAVDYLFKPLNIDVLRAKVSVFADLFIAKIEIKRQEQLLREIERRERDRKLEEVRTTSERRYKNLVEGIRDGIVWAVNPQNHRFTFISQRAEEITGFSHTQWLANSNLWSWLFNSDDQARIRQAFIESDFPVERLALEHQVTRPDGKKIWFHTEVHIERDFETGILEYRGLSVDVTHLKETEEALRNAIQIRDEFLSVASHELKTPITPLQLQMQGFARMIHTNSLHEIPTEKLKNMLEMSDSQIQRLSRLIEQLLDVTKLNQGRFRLELHPINFSDVVRSVIAQLRHEIEDAGCSLYIDVPPDIILIMDHFRIEQVVVNLLTNAIKYGAGKPIQLRLRKTPSGGGLLTIKDEGIGIAKCDQERIFNRFERAVPAKNYGGLGLGLYISKQIVELHQGRISVESEAGHGATFTIELPARPIVLAGSRHAH